MKRRHRDPYLNDKKQRKRGPYITIACNACRKKKTKCSGGEPCDNCKKKGFKCEYREKRNNMDMFNCDLDVSQNDYGSPDFTNTVTEHPIVTERMVPRSRTPSPTSISSFHNLKISKKDSPIINHQDSNDMMKNIENVYLKNYHYGNNENQYRRKSVENEMMMDNSIKDQYFKFEYEKLQIQKKQLENTTMVWRSGVDRLVACINNFYIGCDKDKKMDLLNNLNNSFMKNFGTSEYRHELEKIMYQIKFDSKECEYIDRDDMLQPSQYLDAEIEIRESRY
jgi:hypothetical protein